MFELSKVRDFFLGEWMWVVDFFKQGVGHYKK